MTTGDLKNNLKKLQLELRRIHYKNDVDFEGMGVGNAAAYLPIYHHVFTDYSPHVVKLLSEKGIELYGKTDLRFMEAVYKSMRELFSYKPPITRDQFFSPGFVERKVLMAIDIIANIRKKHSALAPKPAMGKIAPGVLVSKPTKGCTSTITTGVATTTETSDGNVNSGPRVVNEVRNPDKSDKCTSGTGVGATVKPKVQPASQPQHQRKPQAVSVRFHKHPAQGREGLESVPEAGQMVHHREPSEEYIQKKARVVVVQPPKTHSLQQSVDVVDSNVEIINVRTDGEVGMEYENVQQQRPIDTIAQTPCAGAVRSLRHTDPLEQPVEAMMSRLQDTMESLVISLSNLECRMSSVERTMYQVMQSQQTGTGELNTESHDVDDSDDTVTGAQFENLAAKVTLLANRVTLLECQLEGSVPETPIDHATCATSVGPVPSTQRTKGLESPAARPSTVPETPTEPIVSGTLPFSPADTGNTGNSRTCPEVYDASAYLDAESSVKNNISDGCPDIPSPILQSVRNGAERLSSVTEESPGVGFLHKTPKKATSTPTEAHMATPQALKTHFINQETKDKALRMYNMMAETKQMLNLPLNTPERAPRPVN